MRKLLPKNALGDIRRSPAKFSLALLLLSILLSVPSVGTASVYWFNSTSDYIDYVSYYYERNLGSGPESSFEMRVVQPGFELNLEDHEGPEPYYEYFYFAGYFSEYVGGGGGSGDITFTGEEGFITGPANPLVGNYTAINRATLEENVKAALGLPSVPEPLRKVLDGGCIGVVKALMRTTINGVGMYPATPYPESASTSRYGPLKAFRTIEACDAWSPGGGREVVYIKFGNAWKDGVEPTPSGVDNEVPVDSVVNSTVSGGTTNNYITKVGDKWTGVTEGVTDPANRNSMQAQVYDSLAEVDLPTRPGVYIFVKRIVPDGN